MTLKNLAILGHAIPSGPTITAVLQRAARSQSAMHPQTQIPNSLQTLLQASGKWPRNRLRHHHESPPIPGRVTARGKLEQNREVCPRCERLLVNAG